MKIFKFGLNIWITIVSLLSFLLGWVALAHAPKPVQAGASLPALSAPAIPTLEPLQPLQSGSGGNSSSGFQFDQSNQPFAGSFFSAPAPVFSSGGS